MDVLLPIAALFAICFVIHEIVVFIRFIILVSVLKRAAKNGHVISLPIYMAMTHSSVIGGNLIVFGVGLFIGGQITDPETQVGLTAIAACASIVGFGMVVIWGFFSKKHAEGKG